MDIHYFVGVDIAKGTLDWAVFNGKCVVLQTHSVNSVAGIKTVLRLLKGLPGWNANQVIICMEHTAQAALRNLQRSSAGFSFPTSVTNLAGRQFAN